MILCDERAAEMRKSSPGKGELGAKTPIDVSNPFARSTLKSFVKLPAAMVQKTSASVLHGPKELRLVRPSTPPDHDIFVY